MPAWIPDRPGTYDPDLVWDEGTDSWITDDGRAGGGRYKAQIIVISEEGSIYFGES